MKINAAKLATDLVEQGYSPTNAAKVTIDKIANIGGYGGIIVINRKGEIGYHFNTTRMAYASISKTGELISGIDPI